MARKKLASTEARKAPARRRNETRHKADARSRAGASRKARPAHTGKAGKRHETAGPLRMLGTFAQDAEGYIVVIGDPAQLHSADAHPVYVGWCPADGRAQSDLLELVQHGNPFNAVILASGSGSPAQLAEVHEALATWRLRPDGRWFNRAAVVSDWIAALRDGTGCEE